MYRNSIAAVTYLSGQHIYPNKPDPRKEDVNNGTNGWYVTYSAMVCKRIYQTVIGLDIPVKYYDPDASGQDKVLVPDGCNAVERSSFVSADNKNPYIVIQVVGVTDPANSNADIEYYLIVSYHNDKNKFAAWDGGKRFQRRRLTTSRKIRRQIRNLTAPIRPTRALPSAIRSK
ncbi:MAG: hypothetical protein L6V82_00705 [Clostridiales bacterium]|nr:MAG: hypothetical protein L6V82_00705 [Clostridiales bacterium]